jgi:hypothetical protein
VEGNAEGVATRFQPGVVSNPRGRPKKGLITRELERLLESEPLEGRTWAEGIATILLSIANDKKASPQARIAAIKEIADRVEGRPMQPIRLPGMEGDGESRTELRVVVVNEPAVAVRARDDGSALPE